MSKLYNEIWSMEKVYKLEGLYALQNIKER